MGDKMTNNKVKDVISLLKDFDPELPVEVVINTKETYPFMGIGYDTPDNSADTKKAFRVVIMADSGTRITYNDGKREEVDLWH